MSLHCHSSLAELNCRHLHFSLRPTARSGLLGSANSTSAHFRSTARRACHACQRKADPAQTADSVHNLSTGRASKPCKLHQVQHSLDRLPLHVVAAIAAMITTAHPALADIQTVPASQATEYAKPIPKQRTDKGFVALLFAAGAASLFGSALLLEKNSTFFPAINKANQVMRAAEQRNKGRALAEQAVNDLEQQDQMRLQRSVEAGLADARARVLPESDGSNASSSSNTEVKDAKADSKSPSESSSTAAGSHANNGAAPDDDQVPYSAKNKDEASSSPERPKGSQLSDQEKQEQVVKSMKQS